MGRLRSGGVGCVFEDSPNDSPDLAMCYPLARLRGPRGRLTGRENALPGEGQPIIGSLSCGMGGCMYVASVFRIPTVFITTESERYKNL